MAELTDQSWGGFERLRLTDERLPDLERMIDGWATAMALAVASTPGAPDGETAPSDEQVAQHRYILTVAQLEAVWRAGFDAGRVGLVAEERRVFEDIARHALRNPGGLTDRHVQLATRLATTEWP